MIWESIAFGGSCEHTASCYGWAETALARALIVATCGEPPEGCELEAHVHDHELGGHPELFLGWETWNEEPAFWRYLDAAQDAVKVLGQCVDWEELWNNFPETDWQTWEAPDDDEQDDGTHND